jgi:RimJ/RimL family protein N-acetyltransferase
MSKITLRKIKSTDKKYFAYWWRDKELLKLTSGILKLISDKEIEKYFLAMMNSSTDYHFMILLDRKVIGHIVLAKRRNGWYDTQIIIGERQYWGRGYGTKAIKLVLKKAKELRIPKIYLEVRPTNTRAIAAYKNSGFINAGIKKYPKNKYLPKTLRMELKL